MGRGQFNPARTAWHITFGTYLSRLHGGDRPTVDRRQNQRGQPFIGKDEDRQRRALALAKRSRATLAHDAEAEPVLLTCQQRELIERVLPEICARGGWTLLACAAPGPPKEAQGDHVHIVVDADPSVHGKAIRMWVKRWLSEALDAAFSRPGGPGRRWWAEGGSTKPVKDPAYFTNVLEYVRRQRTTQEHG